MRTDIAEELAGAPTVPLDQKAADQMYLRLRRATDATLTPEQRETIRATLAEPLARHIHELSIALDALDGPDPEMSLVYMTDSIPGIRSAMSRLDARLSAQSVL